VISALHHNSTTGYYSSYKTLVPLSILITVFLLNFQHIFIDILWHDDGFWYYLATEGKAIQNEAGRAQITSLGPYLDYFYAYGMLEWGLPVIRACYVLVMFLCSLSLLFIYTKILGLTKSIAIVAATIPNVLPSLIGIPIGLNASYAMWGLLPLLISIIFVFQSFTQKGLFSFFYWFIGFFAYAVGLNFVETSNFMIPNVLLIFTVFFFTRRNKLKSLIFSIPFLVLGIWQIYKQILFTHKAPTQIPLEEIFSRSIQFIEMGSFLPFNSPVSVYITSILALLGFVGLASKQSQIYYKPAHFHCSDMTYKGFLFLWPLIWIISNSIAYVAASPTFRIYDYAYISNFGVVLLQVCGGAYLWYLISTKFGWPKNLSTTILTLTIALLLIFIGIQKSIYLNSVLAEWGETNTSFLLRQSLEQLEIPDEAQILVLNTPTPQQGVFVVNTGYMRYLLNQNDVTALIGSEFFPNNVFAKSERWLDRMRNFVLDRPTIAFRRIGGELKQIKLLLQVKPIKKKELPRLQWSLFDVSSLVSAPLKIASNRGMSSYYAYIENELPLSYTSSNVAFAPRKNPTVFISQKIADEIAKKPCLISSDLKFGDIVTLRSVKGSRLNSMQTLKFLLHVKKKAGNLKLGYRLNNEGSGELVPLWELALEGDNILMEIPLSPNQELNGIISFELLDFSKWPPQPIAIPGNKSTNILKINTHGDCKSSV